MLITQTIEMTAMNNSKKTEFDWTEFKSEIFPQLEAHENIIIESGANGKIYHVFESQLGGRPCRLLQSGFDSLDSAARYVETLGPIRHAERDRRSLDIVAGDKGRLVTIAPFLPSGLEENS